MPSRPIKPAKTTSAQITVRMDADMLLRVDRIASHYEGVLRTKFGRSDAIRMIVAHGVDAVEGAAGLAKAKGGKGR